MAIHFFSLRGLERARDKKGDVVPLRERIITQMDALKLGEFGIVDEPWDVWGLITAENPEHKPHDADRKFYNILHAIRDTFGFIIPRFTDTTQHHGRLDLDFNSLGVQRVINKPPRKVDLTSERTDIHKEESPDNHTIRLNA